jgi:cell wall-associated NlpC family hydrolase
MATWSDKYIGIPYESLNCYELVRTVYAEECGIDIPAPDQDLTAYSSVELARPIVESTWSEVPYAERTAFDVVLFRGLELAHCGVLIDRHQMLHTRETTGAVIENIGDRFWRPRLKGVYRPKTL